MKRYILLNKWVRNSSELGALYSAYPVEDDRGDWVKHEDAAELERGGGERQAAGGAMSEWTETRWIEQCKPMPIETAPFNDTLALAWDEKCGEWVIFNFDHDNDANWMRLRGYTHWYPLPEAPM